MISAVVTNLAVRADQQEIMCKRNDLQARQAGEIAAAGDTWQRGEGMTACLKISALSCP